MNSKEFTEWLEAKNLLQHAKNSAAYFRKILTDCIAVKNEDILIIGDTGMAGRPIAPIVTGAYYFAAKELNLTPQLLILDHKAAQPEHRLADVLQNFNRKNVIVLALSNKLGNVNELGQSFRQYAHENYHRFASATSLGKLSLENLHYFIKSIDVNYEELKANGDKLKDILDRGKEVHVTTEAGTDVYIGIEGRKAINNCGYYRKPREGGNIPAGEVYVAPKWKSVNGTIVIDGSSAYHGGTQLINHPIKIKVEKDEIIDIKGGAEADNLRKTLKFAYENEKYPWGVRIGEFGIGTNPNAKVIGATVIDEKSLGTCHFAVGSNYWFGGTVYASVHLDQILRNPKIYVDGEIVNNI
jgi:leucyl aminopeptidase (aminopeptidase T)